MAAGDEAAPVNGADVLRCLRTATAREHAAVEAALDLMSAQLDRPRLTGVLTRLHAFWGAAEGGLDVWARREPADADAIDWRRRRRTAVFAADLVVLGGHPASGRQPELPAVENTDDALGRLYVLEGSTLGGRFIDRHL